MIIKVVVVPVVKDTDVSVSVVSSDFLPILPILQVSYVAYNLL